MLVDGAPSYPCRRAPEIGYAPAADRGDASTPIARCRLAGRGRVLFAVPRASRETHDTMSGRNDVSTGDGSAKTLPTVVPVNHRDRQQSR